MEREQQVDRGLVALLDWRRGIAADDTLVAEVFDDQEALLEIGLIHRGRREAALPEPIRHGDERHDVIGEMRDRAVRLVTPHRRTVRPGRRIHQQHAFLAERQPFIGPGRGVAAHACAQRLAVAALGDELTRRRHAVDARPERAIAGDAGMAEFKLELGRQRK